MVNSRNIACLILGFGSILGSAHPAELSKVHGTTKSGTTSSSSSSSKSGTSAKSGSSAKSNGSTKSNSDTNTNTLNTAKGGATFNTATSAASAMTIHVNGTESRVPADCIATSYASYPAIVAKCATSILKDIKVPVGGQIAITNLKSQTVRLTPSSLSRPSSDTCIGRFLRHNRLRPLSRWSRPNLPLDHIQLIRRLPNCRS